MGTTPIELRFAQLQWDPARLRTPKLAFRIDGEEDAESLKLRKSPFTMGQYADFFRQHAGQRWKNVLLLGRGLGGTAALWQELLDPDKLVALDLEAPAESPYFLKHVRGRASQDKLQWLFTPEPLDSVEMSKVLAKEFGEPVDLVIDCGWSPFCEGAKALFEFLFPKLRVGGHYILEHWGWAHWPAFLGKDHPWANGTPLIELVKELVGGVASAPATEGQPVRNVHLSQAFAAVERGQMPGDAQRFFELDHFIKKAPAAGSPEETKPRMPNFLIIGAMRSGTTSLYSYLEQHHHVFLSPVKEPRFFAVEGWRSESVDPVTGAKNGQAMEFVWEGVVGTLEDYQALFQNAGKAKAIGEASPLYLAWSERAAPNIHRRLPDAKLIAILRHPVERAYSHYLLFRANGAETDTDFVRAFYQDTDKLYKEQGMYYQRLQPYLKLFPKEQLKVVLFEDLRDHPERLMQDIYKFLGVRDTFVPDVSFHSMKVERSTVAHTSPLTKEIRPTLANLYREDIQQLSKLIGRDLSSWLE